MIGVILLVACLALTGPAMFLLKRAIFGRPRATGRCWRCRFDLAGLPNAAPLCPECGAPVVAPGQRPPTARRERATGVLLALVLLLPVFNIALKFWPRTAAWSREYAAQERGARVMASFLAGDASETRMRVAVSALVGTLAERPMPALFDSPGSFERPHLIAGGYGGDALDAAGRVLNDRAAPGDRFGVLLDAVADAYESVPVGCTTAIDEALCGMLAGSWVLGDEDPVSRWPPPRSLPADQVQRLLDMVLAVQGHPTRMWNQRWGMALEAGIGRGVVPEPLIRRYLQQSFNPRIVVHTGPSVRRGDALFIDIEPAWKTGEWIPVLVQAENPPPPLEGRFTGDAACGLLWNTSIGSYRFEGMLLLPDQAGPLQADIPITALFGPAVTTAYAARHHESKPMWARLPEMRVTKPARLNLTLTESEVPPAAEGEHGVSADTMLSGFGEAECEFDTTGQSPRFEVRIGVTRPPIALTGDLVLRQGGVERAIGWVFAPRIGIDRVRAVGLADGIDPAQPVDVVLRSRRGAIERPFWTPKLWKGELAFREIRPEPAPVPPVNGGR